MEWQPLLLSFQVAMTATAIAALVGIPLGALLSRRHIRGRNLLDAFVTAPLVLPPTVLGYYVLVALGRRSPLGQAFEALTGSQIVFTRTGVVVAATIGALPLIFKSARAALEGVDPRLLQAARTLGAGRLRTSFTVHLPLAKRGIVGGLMLGFARSLGDFGVTLMVAGDIPGETRTASLAVYNAIQGRREADALGMIAVMTTVAILMLYAVNKLMDRRDAR